MTSLGGSACLLLTPDAETHPCMPSSHPCATAGHLQPSWAPACCIWSACSAWPLPEHSLRLCATKHLQRLLLHPSLAASLGVLVQANAAPPMPAELMRRHEVVFKPRSKMRPVHLRRVGAEHVGQLVSVKVRCRLQVAVLAGCVPRKRGRVLLNSTPQYCIR